MTGGQRNGFVQKEQLSVTARRHHGTAPAFEFQEASDPTPTGILTNNLTILIVDRPAPVAHERSTGWRRKDISARAHTIP
jgi:hypothetical protein